jgi:hypothetical protein
MVNLSVESRKRLLSALAFLLLRCFASGVCHLFGVILRLSSSFGSAKLASPSWDAVGNRQDAVTGNESNGGDAWLSISTCAARSVL